MINFFWIKYLLLFAILMWFVSCETESDKRSSLLEDRLGKQELLSLKNQDYISVNQKGGESTVLGSQQKEKFQKLFLRDKSYNFEYRKRAVFVPEWTFLFKDNPAALVQISPSARQVRFIYSGKKVTIDYDPVLEKVEEFLHAL